MEIFTLRRGLAALVLLCLLIIFTGCTGDQDPIVPIATDEVEVVDDHPFPDPDVAIAQVPSTDEAVIEAHVDEILSALAREEQSTSFSGAMVALYIDGSQFEKFNLDAGIAAYESAEAQQKNLDRLPITPYLLEVYEIATSELYSYAESYDKLQQYEKRFLLDGSSDLGTDEFNAVLYEIRMQKVLLRKFIAITSDQKGGPSVSDILKVLDLVGLTFDFFENSENKCALAVTSAAISLASCIVGNIYSCFAVQIKLIKVINKCRKDNIPYCTLNPSPCCGKVCIQGYSCNYLTGQCLFDPNAQPCNDCRPGEQCLDNRCVPF